MKNQIKSFYKLLGLFAIPAFSQESYASTSTSSLCSSGEYLSNCGQYAIGVNWLKKVKYMAISDDDTAIFDHSDLDGTYFEDIYDYSESDNHNMENLRNFFYGKGIIQFKPKYNDTHPSVDNSAVFQDENGIISIDIEKYPGLKKARNDLLSKYCTTHKENGSVQAVNLYTCEKCPDNSRSSSSNFTYNSDLTHLDWNARTIADCYISSLSTDATGTFYYADENDNQLNCKYSSMTYGDNLPDESCTPTNADGVSEAMMIGGNCKIMKCNKNYTLNNAGTACEPNNNQNNNPNNNGD